MGALTLVIVVSTLVPPLAFALVLLLLFIAAGIAAGVVSLLAGVATYVLSMSVPIFVGRVVRRDT